MRVALFSDIHGKILLPFKLVDLYQRETGQKVDLILQCGDLGAYPDAAKLDKATIKHAKYDRDELGFSDDFVTENSEIKAFLDALDLDMICVRGNHEDQEFLDDLEQSYVNEPRFPIDVYKRVFVCKSGHIQTFSNGEQTLSFAGIGRIGDRKGRKDSKYIQDYEREQIKQLCRSREIFDVLITHDKRSEGPDGYGTQEVGDLLDSVIFKYHFYGHTGEDFKMDTDDNGITKSVKIKELEYESSGILPHACMIILEKGENDEITLEVVERSLLTRLTKHNWKY